MIIALFPGSLLPCIVPMHLPDPNPDPDSYPLTPWLSAFSLPRCTTPTRTSRSGPSAGTRPSPAAAPRAAPTAAASHRCRLGQGQQLQQGQGPVPGCLPCFLRGVFRCCLVTTAASSSAGRTASRWGGKWLGWKWGGEGLMSPGGLCCGQHCVPGHACGLYDQGCQGGNARRYTDE